MTKQSTAAAPAANTQVSTQRGPSLMAAFAAKFNVEADKMTAALKATAFKVGRDQEVTNEQLLALIVVANQYGLNPFTKELYAFPDQKGITPIVSIDGWIRIINERPELESIEFAYATTESAEDLPAWIECRITRKDRTAPIVIREYMDECRRDTGPWKSHPSRMLRHKALIQCARVAFGFGGIHDPDEAERIANAIDVTPVASKPRTAAPRSIHDTQANEDLAAANSLADEKGSPDQDENSARG